MDCIFLTTTGKSNRHMPSWVAKSQQHEMRICLHKLSGYRTICPGTIKFSIQSTKYSQLSKSGNSEMRKREYLD